MKVVILAGGLGTRLAEETEVRPKPMVEIGGRPILWHIMKHYTHFGFNEFVIALGHKGDYIKRYFLDLFHLSGNITVDMTSGKVDLHGRRCDDWTVHLMETGENTLTGGRICRLAPLLQDDTFMVTYGDGVANIDLQALLKFHNEKRCIATVTAVRPPARFGGLKFKDDMVTRFIEKPQIGEGWINGGYLVFEPQVFKYLHGDDSSLEADALESLAADQQLSGYRHDEFWQCMDTLRDKRLLERLWERNEAPWKLWT